MKTNISILIPCYNPDLSKFDRCLSSIRKSGYGDEQIVVGLQGQAELSQLQKKYSFQVVNFQKPSSYFTRIGLIPYATGDYIWYVDCDDVILPNSLKELSKIVSCESEEPDICLFGVYERENNKFFSPSSKRLGSREEVLNEFYRGSSFYGPLWQKIIKKSVLEKASFPNIDLFLGDDTTATLAVCKEANSAIAVPNIFYEYVERGGSSASNVNLNFFMKFLPTVKFVENDRYNYPDKPCSLNNFIISFFLTEFYLFLGQNKISRSELKLLRENSACKTAYDYLKSREGKPKLVINSHKIRLISWAFVLFYKKHFYVSTFLCRAFRRLSFLIN